MDFHSLPSFYLSAPTSPNGCTPNNLQFYSTRSSPGHPGSFGYEPDAKRTNDDEFEFGTGWDREYRLPARSNSFSTMAYADELFCNGRFLPLKLPPRLQTSVPTSPGSLTPRTRRPLWNDGFDPFMIALEKVSEETEGRTSVHRRSRSYSPFRNPSTRDRDQKQPRHTWPGTDLTVKKPTVPEITDRKGSMYSRWVRSQTMVNRTEVQRPAAGQAVMKRLWLTKPVKPVKRSELTYTESKMQKMKSVLLRYASLKKETNDTKKTREIVTISKVSYFKRLTLSFKTNRRKKESVDAKMAIVKHDNKPSR